MPKLDELKQSLNIAELLEDEELAKVSQRVFSGYETDRESRKEVEELIEKAMKIAKQTMESKNMPWPNSSNIKFPLITKGGIDFAARMLPELIKNDKVVKVAVTGADPNDVLIHRAYRVQEHMSFQLLKQNDEWEDGMDHLLSMLPIVGTVFKKTYWDVLEDRPRSEMCLPTKIVVNNNCKSLETARRITHEFTFHANDVVERIRAELYCDVDVDSLKSSEGYSLDAYDPPMEFLEQHCWLDLDDDGYEEPYIVVMHKATRKILRIVHRFEKIQKNSKGNIKKIFPVNYFTDYHFLPSPDGSFYSLGFGMLLYPINATINTLFNQLVDSGTLHNQQSGFIGRGLRLKGGEFRMSLGEWKILDAATGTNIQQNVVPLPTKEPSQVSFQLLEMLIGIGKDLTSVNEALEGKVPAQNVAATTMLTLVEQGMKVYNSITKRLYRAVKKELCKLFYLNRMYLSDDEYRQVLNDPRVRVKEDYEVESYDILPVADPNMASDAQRNAKAQALMSVPGLDPYETTKYFLESMQLDQRLIGKLLKKPDPQAPPPPEILKVQAETEKFKAQAMQAQATAQDIANKGNLDMAKLQLAVQAQADSSIETKAKLAKIQLDAQRGDVKLMIQGAKAEHDAKVKEAKLNQSQQSDFGHTTLEAAKVLTKAHEVQSQIQSNQADKLLKAKELQIKEAQVNAKQDSSE